MIQRRERPGAALAPALAFAAAALLSTAAGAQAPVRGGILRVVAPQLPTVLDPVVSTLQTNWLVAQNACEGLFALDDNWKPQPMLASSFAYGDGGKTLTVKLRSGIKFHSGATLAADDVVASLKRYAQSAGTGAVLKSLVTDIRAAAPDTVVFALANPTGMVPGVLTLAPASILSKQALAAASGSTPVKDLDCTGPYKVVEFQPDKQALLGRFDAYQSRSEPSSGSAGKKAAYADQIAFIPQSEPSVRRDSVLTGKTDIATTLPFDFYNAIKNNPAAQPVITQDSRSLTLVFNTKQGPTANPKLRQAIYFALNMEPLMRAADGNPQFYAVDPSWVPDRNSVWHSNAGAEAFGKANPEKVKQLLAESGYKGEPLRWLTSKDFYQSHYLPAITAQQQLEKFGIKIDVKVMPAAAYVQSRTDPAAYEMFSSFLPSYVDPVVIPYLTSTFPGFWNDAKKDALIRQLSETVELKDRVVVWGKLQALIYEQMPYLKFGTESLMSAARKGVTGLSTSPANDSFYVNVAPPPR